MLYYSDEIDTARYKGDKDFEFKDKDEEYMYHERTETTKTEKITSTKRRAAGKQPIDLRAAANQLQSSETQVRREEFNRNNNVIETNIFLHCQMNI